MVVVYIASPYTMGDVGMNVREQMEAADRLMDYGYCPIVPLLSHFLHIHRPRPYDDWAVMDLELVRRSDFVLRLPGESVGADKEVALACELGIPVVESIEELREKSGVRHLDHIGNSGIPKGASMAPYRLVLHNCCAVPELEIRNFKNRVAASVRFCCDGGIVTANGKSAGCRHSYNSKEAEMHLLQSKLPTVEYEEMPRTDHIVLDVLE